MPQIASAEGTWVNVLLWVVGYGYVVDAQEWDGFDALYHSSFYKEFDILRVTREGCYAHNAEQFGR
jgi:hypothetical protein